MGLTNSSTGVKAIDSGLVIKKQSEQDKVIALAGNPNVGKSTVFNALTGMNQHTGNWPGKTVANAQGYCKSEKNSYVLVDIPGTYSLMANSVEEEVARDFICAGVPDAVVVVCDATCLERNMNLVLQTLEITPNVAICVNLMDEAKKKHIKIDLGRLSERLGVPVISTAARRKKGLRELLGAMDTVTSGGSERTPLLVRYSEKIENAISILEPVLREKLGGRISSRWLSLRLLCGEFEELRSHLGVDISTDDEILTALDRARECIFAGDNLNDFINDQVVTALLRTAEDICSDVVTYENASYAASDRRIDRILTGKWTAFPVMLVLFALIFWITITGANYPSELLSGLFRKGQELLTRLFGLIGAPEWLHGIVVLGMYRVLAWVVAVMLPPMAIFFPLFTLLEDAGYLPRIAYNLDRPFKCCHACGKQALTMCMGFGCNAAGVVGCRIISSPRERLIAILTNNFVPCNGRFPMLITIISIFFALSALPWAVGGLAPAVMLAMLIVLSVLVTLLVSFVLSKTLLQGEKTAFTLELPPYRMPNVGQVLVRSLIDRTLHVLGRAVMIAAPCGAIIYLLANISIGGVSLLTSISGVLDPVGQFMGLDGAILLAFILGLPANELVIPIMLMIYTAGGSLADIGTLSEMRMILVQNGWTWATAVSFILFALMHWPCGTTLMTIKKETGSVKWTLLGMLVPTVTGIAACVLFTFIVNIF